MAMAQKPTILIVPAACHPTEIYKPLATALEKANYPVSVIPIPSVGASPGLPDFSADVHLIRQIILSIISTDAEVLLICHSYGGLPGSAALHDLGLTQRASQGQSGGVTRVIFAASHALKEGDKIPGADDMAALRAFPGLDEADMTLLVTPEAARQIFFHDLPEGERERWARMLRPHSIGAMWSMQTYAAWRHVPSTHVVCEGDRVMPVERQEEMIREARKVEGRAFDQVFRLECGHEPVLAAIEDMVRIVGAAVEGERW